MSGFSQLRVVPIIKEQPATKKRLASASRIQDTVILTPRTLPFWDDFSVSNKPYYPDSTRWLYGESVYFNDGIGINPPSLGVVSFDGLDSLDKPYDPTNPQAKGFGDKLVSWPIDLSIVPPDQRDSVYLSFFYQYEGFAEYPDIGDKLVVEFKNDSGVWITMATLQDTVVNRQDTTYTLKKYLFNPVILSVNDSHFFHAQFQFRFRNFGRISGPWDNWNVDYVYLNAHRFSTDLSFPDRTIYQPLSSLFGDYWSIPVKHFLTNPAGVLTKPYFSVTNLRLDQGPGNGQPINYSSGATIESWRDSVLQSVKVVKLDSAFAIFPDLQANQKRHVFLNKIPAASDFNSNADSIRVSLFAGINSGDNIIDHVPPRDSGDYTPNYIPINFRVNDSTRVTYTLSSYYGYDDGSAEYAAGLTAPGAEIAYLFKMQTPDQDTLVAVDIYFPNVGDQSSQNIILIIRKDTATVAPLYTETIQLPRSAHNRFVRHVLSENAVIVQGSFLVGWSQTSSAVISIGLDKNHDTGNNIFFDVNGYWEQNQFVHGSLMIHPVFGKANLVTGLPETFAPLEAFPNPNQGTFYLTEKPDRLEIFDSMGRRMDYDQEAAGEKTRVELLPANPGMYILRAFVHGKAVSRKIMVLR